MDHSHAIDLVIEKYAEYNKHLYVAFVGYEKSFDSIEIQAFVEALRRQGVLDVYLQTINNIYKDCAATLLLHERSSEIPIGRGVRQGDTISSMLFTACLEEVFKRLDWEEKGIRTDGEYLSNLRFAGDIVLFSNDGDELENMIDDLHKESIKIGLKMNRQKTKVMLYSLAKEREFKINNEPLQCVNEYVYLGQLITGTPTHEKEIPCRIMMGWNAFGRHYEIMTGDFHYSEKYSVTAFAQY